MAIKKISEFITLNSLTDNDLLLVERDGDANSTKVSSITQLSKDYINSQNFATETYVQNQNYATQSWVNDQIGSATGGLVTPAWVNSTISTAIAPLATKDVATTSANGLMSSSDKSKLNGVANNANNYVHPTTSGNKHIPTGGSSGQVLKWKADGEAQWGNDNNTTYTLSSFGITATKDELNKLDGVTTTSAQFNYLNTATGNIQTQLNDKANSSHNHTVADINNLGSGWADKLTTTYNDNSLILGNTTLTETELQQIKLICGVFNVGDALIIDGIESYVLYKDERSGYALAVDKNHDLSYYVNRSDWVDSEDYKTSPGTFGYEWGGYRTETGIQDTTIGTGLNNTNQLISKNLQPYTSGWYVVWDKIEEFRQSHSDKWFLPSKDELNLIYEARNNLSNLSLNKSAGYWSSSEATMSLVWRQLFNDGSQNDLHKNTHSFRARLCRYIPLSSEYI